MADLSTPDYDDWVRSLPDYVRSDSIWNLTAYKQALYARRCAWPDSVNIARHRLGEPIARQLYRAVASIGANIADGWSRTTGLDRARFFEYALSSAREAIVWYLARCACTPSQSYQATPIAALAVAPASPGDDTNRAEATRTCDEGDAGGSEQIRLNSSPLTSHSSFFNRPASLPAPR